MFAVLVLGAYANSFDAPFVFDDLTSIRDNSHIQIEELSAKSLYAATFENHLSRPVAYLTFGLNYYLGRDQVWGYHLVNVLIHAASAWLVFCLGQFILPRLGGEEAHTETAVDATRWIAAGAALLFALHPIQTQAVTYLVQRMASMCAMFYLAALLAYLYGRVAATSRGRVGWWGAALLLWLLALGTKEIAVTWPLAVLLVEWIVMQSGDRGWLWKQTRWLIAIVAVMVVIAFVFKGTDFFKLFTRGYSRRPFSMTERLLTEGRVMIHYLSLVVLPLPSRLTLVYDFPVSSGLFTPPSTILCWAAIIGSIVFAFLYAHRYRLLCLTILWFFLHLVVESTIIPLELVYEHRVYLPLVMVCLLASSLIFRWAPSVSAGLAVTATLGVLLGIGTYQRNQTWRTVEGLWQDNVAKQPSEPRGYFNLGVIRLEEGHNDQAMALFSEAIQHGPKFHRAYVERGILHERNRNPVAALEDYTLAISIPFNEAVGFGDYAAAHTRRGALLRRKGDFNAAVDDFTKALEINPGYARAYLERGMAHAFLKKPQQATDDFLGAIHFGPDLPDTHSRYAWFLATYPDAAYARSKEAIEHATRACELTEWKDASRLGTLAAAYARAGEFEQAIQWQRKCYALTPPTRRAAAQQRLQLYEQGRPLIINYGA